MKNSYGFISYFQKWSMLQNPHSNKIVEREILLFCKHKKSEIIATRVVSVHSYNRQVEN